MNSYSEKVYFHLPGAFYFNVLYEIILNYMRTHGEYFEENALIGSIYGSPNLAWNGGRLMITPVSTEEELLSCKSFFENYGIPCRFTFTNCLLEKHHLLDDFCNFVLDTFANTSNSFNNEIICNSPLLEEYIRNKHPGKFDYISSTTKLILDKEELFDEICKPDYKLTVLDYRFNNTPFLKTINHPEKCELLVNPVCSPDCKQRKLHYEVISRAQLLGIVTTEIANFRCESSNQLFRDAMKNPKFISKETINNLASLGFKHFKLEGRTTTGADLIEMLSYYLAREEYIDKVRQDLLRLAYSR